MSMRILNLILVLGFSSAASAQFPETNSLGGALDDFSDVARSLASEPIGGPIYSDADVPSVQRDMERIAQRMNQLEGPNCDRWKAVNAVATDEDMANVRKTNVNIIGEDGRRYLGESGERIAAAVGRISCRDPRTGASSFSTATFVNGTRTLLAVGHFDEVVKSDGSRFRTASSNCEYQLYDGNGQMYFSSKITGAISRSNTDLTPGTYTYSSRDRVLVEIESEMPAGVNPIQILPMSTASVSRLPSNSVSMVFFDRGISNSYRKVQSRGCSPVRTSYADNLVSHTCDAVGGSGGPLIRFVNNTPYIIGMHIADRGTNENFAILINDSDFLADLRRNRVHFASVDSLERNI